MEVPLRFLALARRRQSDDATDAGIEALRDALDGATRPGGVTAFEEHDQLEVLVHHPVLEPHQLLLQPKQLLEIDRPGIGTRIGIVGKPGDDASEAIIVQLQFELLVEAVGDLSLDPLPHSVRRPLGFTCFGG